MKKIAIYLAGTIQKGHEKGKVWTDKDMDDIKNVLKAYDILFLNPAFRTDDLSDSFSVFGRDMVQVFSSHFVFVDAREKRGLGVGAEMMWAKVNRIPVLAWAPCNSHYHLDQASVLGVSISNYVHPFVDSLCDKIVETPAAGAEWIAELVANPNVAVKGLDHIAKAMEYYKEQQFQQDKPMQEMFKACSEFQQRMQRAHPEVIFKN